MAALSIITGNSLGEGLVVFQIRRAAGALDIAQAEVLRHQGGARRGGRARQCRRGREPRRRALRDRGDARRRAASCRCKLREKIRADGPTTGHSKDTMPPPSKTARPEDKNMYRYDEFDHAFVNERVAQFRDQVARRLTGELDEDQFKPLRLQNGVYLQLHAYMLRIAVPYGTLNPRQVRHARATSRAPTTRATATSPRGRTCSSTGRS